MALKPCKECGHNVSTKATSCPQCGARMSKPTSLVTKVIAGIFIMSAAIAVFSPKPDAAPATQSAHKPPADPKREAAFQRTVAVVRSIKASLREPSSVQWEGILRNDDATVVCVTYRARNGFGGMNLEQAAYANGRISTSAAAWNKHCAGKTLTDERKIRLVV